VALRLEEREEISRGIAAGRSIRRIAARLLVEAYAEAAPGGRPGEVNRIAFKLTALFATGSKKAIETIASNATTVVAL
jgi:hypothetical protein